MPQAKDLSFATADVLNHAFIVRDAAPVGCPKVPLAPPPLVNVSASLTPPLAVDHVAPDPSVST